MKCEHGHNDLFLHKKTHAQHLNLSFIFKHIMNFCRFFCHAGHLQFNLNLLELLAILFTHTHTHKPIRIHSPCRSTGVQNNLSPNLWSSFFLFSVYFHHLFSYFINLSVCLWARRHTHSIPKALYNFFPFLLQRTFYMLCCCLSYLFPYIQKKTQ